MMKRGGVQRECGAIIGRKQSFIECSAPRTLDELFRKVVLLLRACLCELRTKFSDDLNR